MHEGGHGFHQLADEYGTCTGASCGIEHQGHRNHRDASTPRSIRPATRRPPAASGTCGSATRRTRKARHRPAGHVVGQPLRRHRPVPPVGELDDEQPVRHQREHRLTRSRASRWSSHLARREAHRFDRAGGGRGHQPGHDQGQRHRSGGHQRRLDRRRGRPWSTPGTTFDTSTLAAGATRFRPRPTTTPDRLGAQQERHLPSSVTGSTAAVRPGPARNRR